MEYENILGAIDSHIYSIEAQLSYYQNKCKEKDELIEELARKNEELEKKIAELTDDF